MNKAHFKIFMLMRKLFILGWDNGLIEDVVETKLHPSYMTMLAKIDPFLATKWTIENTRLMQGLHPDKIWQDFTILWGKEKSEQARKVFYEAYAHTPQPQLTENAFDFVKKAYDKGCCVIAISNKTQDILHREMTELGVNNFFSDFIGTDKGAGRRLKEAEGEEAKFEARCRQITIALQTAPNVVDVVMIAHAGYAKPAYAVGIPRFEEASPQVFDWLSDEVERQASTYRNDWDDDLL